MWWAAAIAGGLSLFGASKAKSAGREARRIANMNADSSKKETDEEIRRMMRGNRQREGYARAVAGASGFSVQKGTSQQGYIDELVSEGRRQVSFTGMAGRRKEKIIRRGGQLAYKQASAQSLSMLGNAAGSFSQSYSLWKG